MCIFNETTIRKNLNYIKNKRNIKYIRKNKCKIKNINTIINILDEKWMKHDMTYSGIIPDEFYKNNMLDKEKFELWFKDESVQTIIVYSNKTGLQMKPWSYTTNPYYQ